MQRRVRSPVHSDVLDTGKEVSNEEDAAGLNTYNQTKHPPVLGNSQSG